MNNLNVLNSILVRKTKRDQKIMDRVNKLLLEELKLNKELTIHVRSMRWVGDANQCFADVYKSPELRPTQTDLSPIDSLKDLCTSPC